MCISKNVKDAKHTRYIARKIWFVLNDEEYNMHKIVWCEGGLKLADIRTKNVTEDQLNTILVYTMVIIDNLWNTCTRGVIEYRRVWIIRYSDDSSGFGLYWLDSIGLKYWIQHLKLLWKTY